MFQEKFETQNIAGSLSKSTENVTKRSLFANIKDEGTLSREPETRSKCESPSPFTDNSAVGSTLFFPTAHGFRAAWREDTESAAAGLAKVDPSVVGVLAQVEAQQLRSSSRKRHTHLSERTQKRAPAERLMSKLQQRKQKNEQKIAFLDKARNVPQWMSGRFHIHTQFQQFLLSAVPMML